MHIAIFCHSIISDWNHGNAHFLRGVTTELISLGHRVDVYEPRNAWSVQGLIAEAGESALCAFERQYPLIKSTRYDSDELNLEHALNGADLVLVHEWNDPELVQRIGRVRKQSPGMIALFHDTHHRAVSSFKAIAGLDLHDYDGALLFGRSLAQLYERHNLVRRTWVWHEAADTRVFYRRPDVAPAYDLVWIGNWGDEERSAELREFLVDPVRALGLQAVVYGVRYPASAVRELNSAGIQYCGWLPNHQVPLVLTASRITVHVPRRPYVCDLPGVPTIRVFEALACGTPLVCAPWQDTEGLFDVGSFEVAKNGHDMQGKLRAILDDPAKAQKMVERGLNSIHRYHTCAHRAAQLLEIYSELMPSRSHAAIVASSAVASGTALPENLTGAQGASKESVKNVAYPARKRRSAHGLNIAFFGSSLVSAYWNGAATYYRGIIKTLSRNGHRVTFYEPDAFERQSHRDIAAPSWAGVRVFSPAATSEVLAALEEASAHDLVIKCSGVGVLDELLEREVVRLKRRGVLVAFWDVDAPATLARIAANPLDPFRVLIPEYDYIFTYGGGDPVVAEYRKFGARRCTPIYNALDPETHFRVAPQEQFRADLALLANRLPDREARVEQFFVKVAAEMAAKRFLLGGSGWHDKPFPNNLCYCGHVYTSDHNAFNSSAIAVLNINRDSMAQWGYSPPTRIFEAAGAAACIISDQWTGIELFLEPGREILTAVDGEQVADHLRSLSAKRCRQIGEAARRRIIAEHTYEERGRQFENALGLND